MLRLVSALFLAIPVLAQEIRLTQIATGIAAPTDIQSANDGTGRLFLVQQNGIVRIHRNGSLLAAPFLDIRSRTTGSGERGLLGLAFPPDFARKQRFFVDYTNLAGDTVIAQYRVGANPDAADAASETILITIPQPYANHNGGQLRFGPDGYLYIAMGDGGSGGDPQGNAQNRNSLLGKLLRVDVETEPGRLRIPPDNPFVNQGGARGEIWAYGLRNPWRFSFDRLTGDLWIGDVGQDAWEEIDFQPASSRGGENYGWNITEGAHCYRPSSGCNMTGITLPVAEIRQGPECSVTGGFVYRGNAVAVLRGTYVYSDYCSGRIFGLTRQVLSSASRTLLNSGFRVTTFGEDEAGELYVANAANGTIHRIDGTAVSAPRFDASAVVNGASFAPGLTPGSLATVFAAGVRDTAGITAATVLPLPTSLGGVSVTVGGIAAPIHAVANVNGQEQVNFQVPFEMRGRTAADVVVTRDGLSSSAVSVPVIDIQPAVFSGVVVHNADYSLATASNPLARGEYAFVYAAGLGAVTNQPANGAPGPLPPALALTTANVHVTIAGVDCPVQFAGLAPGYAGVYQVNFQVPQNVAGGTQPLVVSVGAVSSPAVQVAIR